MNVDTPSRWASSRSRGKQAQPRKIVVVEDEAIVAADLVERLRRVGHEVAPPISSGEEAVELILEESAEPPDLVLIDIALGPGIDGIEAARLIKARADVPILYVTANSDRKTMEEARLTDPFGYITKPFDGRDLEIAVEIAIRRHDVEQELAEAKANAEAALARGGHLEGFLSICAYCNRIGDESDQWWPAHVYLARQTDVELSHGVCPACYTKEFNYPEPTDE